MSSRAIIIAIAVLAALGALGGFAAYVRHLGYQDGFTDASAVCTAEKRAIEQANDRAISDAERELMRAGDGVSLKQLEIDNALSRNDQAAAADPAGTVQCLVRPGSVLRLNTIR